MKGSKTSRSNGFTIIETLVYLAIAGVLFLITIFYLGGRQRATQFRQGVREFESTLNDIANDTSTGVYPSFNDIECSVSGNSINLNKLSITDPDNPVRPGQNNACTFIGNVIQLTNNEPNKTGADYFTHTLIGQNIGSSGGSFVDTKPKALFETDVVDATQEFTIPWGVVVDKVYMQDVSVAPGDITPINGIAYLYSIFGDNNVAPTALKTGVATISLYVRDADTKETLNGYRTSINYENNPTGLDTLKPIGQRVVHICLAGPNGASAMIEIGGQAGSFAARTNFNASAECLS